MHPSKQSLPLVIVGINHHSGAFVIMFKHPEKKSSTSLTTIQLSSNVIGIDVNDVHPLKQ
jgi:hypothetical protein